MMSKQVTCDLSTLQPRWRHKDGWIVWERWKQKHNGVNVKPSPFLTPPSSSSSPRLTLGHVFRRWPLWPLTAVTHYPPTPRLILTPPRPHPAPNPTSFYQDSCVCLSVKVLLYKTTLLFLVISFVIFVVAHNLSSHTHTHIQSSYPSHKATVSEQISYWLLTANQSDQIALWPRIVWI